MDHCRTPIPTGTLQWRKTERGPWSFRKTQRFCEQRKGGYSYVLDKRRTDHNQVVSPVLQAENKQVIENIHSQYGAGSHFSSTSINGPMQDTPDYLSSR